MSLDMQTGLSSASIDSTDWNDPQSIAETVNAICRNREYKREAERSAMINLEFLQGNQHLKWSRINSRMERDYERPGSEVIRTVNIILPSVEQRLARLVRRDPVWRVLSSTDDTSDQVTAKLSNDVLNWYYVEGLKMSSIIRDAAMWAMATRTVFLCPSWDPNAGEEMVITPDQMTPHGAPPQAGIQAFAEMFGEEALAQGGAVRKTGDVAMSIAPLFEMDFWPFNIIHFNDADIWIRSRIRTIGEIASTFGMKRAQVRELASTEMAGTVFEEEDYKTALSNDTEFSISPRIGPGDGSDGELVVREVWKKPDPDWIGGRHAVVIGNTTIRPPQDLQLRSRRTPVVVLQEKPLPGKLWGTCTVDQMRSMQQEANQAISDEANHRKNMTHHTMVRISGDVSNDKAWHTRPGKINIVSSPGHVPQVVRRPEIGNDPKIAFERALRSMGEISGTSQADLGDPRGAGVKSGVAIAEVKETNDMRLIGFANEMDEAICTAGSMILELLMDNMVDTKIIHVIGENNRGEVKHFNGEMLRPSKYGQPGANPANLRVDSFRQLPSSKGQMFAALEVLTGGQPVLDPATDRALIGKILDIGELNEAFDVNRRDQSKVNDEHTMWLQGGQVGMPNASDNDTFHYSEHKRWKQTEQYKMVVQQFPQIAQEIDQHCHMHEVGVLEEILRPQYLNREADIRLYQEFRQRQMMQIQQMQQQGADPQAIQQALQMVQVMLPGPLAIMGQMQEQQAEAQKGQKPARKPQGKKSPRTSKPAKPPETGGQPSV